MSIGNCNESLLICYMNYTDIVCTSAIETERIIFENSEIEFQFSWNKSSLNISLRAASSFEYCSTSGQNLSHLLFTYETVFWHSVACYLPLLPSDMARFQIK